MFQHTFFCHLQLKYNDYWRIWIKLYKCICIYVNDNYIFEIPLLWKKTVTDHVTSGVLALVYTFVCTCMCVCYNLYVYHYVIIVLLWNFIAM